MEFEGRVISLHDNDLNISKNSFTIIVGKNGSGKSRFLRQLTHECMRAKVNSEQSTVLGALPGNVIAASTSPFDRFPIGSFSSLRSGDTYVDEAQGYYFYQGLRGLFSPNLSMSFMVRIIAAVFRALMNNAERLSAIMDVLAYLGFEKEMNVKLSSSISRSTLERLAEDGGFNKYKDKIRGIGIEAKRLIARLTQEPEGRTSEVIEALKYYLFVSNGKPLEFALSINSAKMVGQLDERLVVLMEYGVLKLKHLSLHKSGIRKTLRINDASSGEQCVVLTMLGIAARIKDGSLICIDEPEICLHPEWQERYIQLLMSTFQGFNSCQFIVATHSPQIVSRLGSENCYVLDLQNNSLQPAKVFNNRSVDFQLAQVFNAPGFKNEYMMRELLSIVGTLSSGQDLSPKQRDFIGGAKALKSAFSSDDPVLHLINMVVEALKVKGAQGV